MLIRKQVWGYNKSTMFKNKEIWVAGLAIMIVQMIANLGIFVRYSEMTEYAVSKETYNQGMSAINDRLTNIENQLKETNNDIKLLLRYYKAQ